MLSHRLRCPHITSAERGQVGQRGCWKRPGRVSPVESCSQRESVCSLRPKHLIYKSKLLRSVLHEDAARLGSHLFRDSHFALLGSAGFCVRQHDLMQGQLYVSK